MQPLEVAIVGGGPAGAYCGFELSKKGIMPTILNDSHLGGKPCGGGISPTLLKRFPFVEKFRENGFTFGEVRIISCLDTQVITNTFENGFCISRKCLDQGILDMAEGNGTKIIKEKAVAITKKENAWVIKTNKRTLAAKVVVGADGVNSVVRRETVGPITAENLNLTFGYLTSKLDKEDATIKFLEEIPGYIWVFPGKGYSNIGVGSELTFGKMLKKLLDGFIKSFFPKTKILSRYSALLPSATNPNFFGLPCAGKNWVLIGDAAGHVDPISGEGILYALWDGKIAAQSIAEDCPESFDKAWRAEFGQTLVDRCKAKNDYYDPLRSAISIFKGLANKSYSWPTT